MQRVREGTVIFLRVRSWAITVRSSLNSTSVTQGDIGALLPLEFAVLHPYCSRSGAVMPTTGEHKGSAINVTEFFLLIRFVAQLVFWAICLKCWVVSPRWHFIQIVSGRSQMRRQYTAGTSLLRHLFSHRQSARILLFEVCLACRWLFLLTGLFPRATVGQKHHS